MIRVALLGVFGRMGRALTPLLHEAEDLSLAVGLLRPGHPQAGESLPGGARLEDALEPALAQADLLIDFSRADASVAAAEACAARGLPAVIGTTGLGPEQRARIEEAARRVPLVFAPNMSVGVNVLCALVERARELLGSGFAPALFEAHHAHKRDAPSGTALRLAGLAGVPPAEVAVVRGGDLAGEHTVYLLGLHERLELTHRATSPVIFARGALRAARWVIAAAPGPCYGMEDVLGLRGGE